MCLALVVYSIAVMSAVSMDPALVNANSIAIVISRAHLDVAGWAIVKCPLGELKLCVNRINYMHIR